MDRDNRSQIGRGNNSSGANQGSQSGYGELNDSYIYGMDAKNRAEVKGLWQITYEGLDPDIVRNLMEIRETDVPKADYWTVQYLAKNFEIKNVPKIKYDFYEGPYPPDRRGGGMDYYTNTLHIARHRLIDGKRSRDDEFKICNIIAHELWHAYQFQEVNKGTRWGKLYEHNFLHYKEQVDILTDVTKPGWNTPYEQQLVEREAIAVGTAFERFCRDVMVSPNRVRPESELGDNLDDAGPENDTYDDLVNDYAEQQAILEQYRRSREELRPQTVQDIYDELDDKSTSELVFSLPEIRETLELYAKGEAEDFVMDEYDFVNSWMILLKSW